MQASSVNSNASTAVSIDNEIVGTPEIECGADRVEMLLRTREPFFGKIFVKGNFCIRLRDALVPLRSL